MSDLEIAVANAIVMLNASSRLENTVSEQLLLMTETITRQQSALSTMLDLFYINRMRLVKAGSLSRLLDLLKVAIETHGQFQSAALEIAHALQRACDEVQNARS